MRTLTFSLLAMLMICTAAIAQKQRIVVTSKSFADNSIIPVKYSCEGDDTNPPVHIADLPVATKSVALIMHDPDAPMAGGFTHWVMWNIKPGQEITEKFGGAVQGLNGTKQRGYKGMCPPSGTHHYIFMVYALDTELDLDPTATDKASLEIAMKGHILADGKLTGLYKKTK